MACLAALAGFLYGASQGVVAPDLGSFQLGTAMVIWTAVGGRGTLFGPVIAAVAINYLSALLSGAIPFIWQLIIGVVFVAVVMYLPGGVASFLGRLARRVVRAWQERSPASGLATNAQSPITAPRTSKARVASLEAIGVSQRFGSFQALWDVHLSAGSGELVSIVGPNGAGKTTFMKCISDGAQRSGGTIRVGGQDIGRRPPEKLCELGVRLR
jgi:branched-chain amino acid transport system permease protein